MTMTELAPERDMVQDIRQIAQLTARVNAIRGQYTTGICDTVYANGIHVGFGFAENLLAGLAAIGLPAAPLVEGRKCETYPFRGRIKVDGVEVYWLMLPDEAAKMFDKGALRELYQSTMPDWLLEK